MFPATRHVEPSDGEVFAKLHSDDFLYNVLIIPCPFQLTLERLSAFKNPYLPHFIIHHTTGCFLEPCHARDKETQVTDRGFRTRSHVLKPCTYACTVYICIYVRNGISRSVQGLEYRLSDPGISVRFSSRARKARVVHSLQTGCGAHPFS